MKQILLFSIAILFGAFVKAQEPTAVHLTNNGQIDWLYYDLSQHSSVHPLTGIYLTGKGKVKYLRLNIQGCSFLLDEFGQPNGVLQGPFAVDWDHNNKIDRLKDGYNTIARFYYDYNGRLVKIKNDSFDVLFALSYDFDGQLEKIDKGGFEYFARFYYNFDDHLEGIKTDDFDHVWKVYYDWDDRLEKIKDDNYDERVRFNYHNNAISHVARLNTITDFYIGQVFVDYLHGRISQSPGYCGTGTTGNNQGGGQHFGFVNFFKGYSFNGNRLAYGVGDYAQIPNGWNDEISSIQIPQGLVVTIYEHANFQGGAKTISGNWDAEYSWNNEISSFRIFANNRVVNFYKGYSMSGDKLTFPLGNYAQIPDEWNDEISSIQIPPGVIVNIYEHANFQGDAKTISGNWDAEYSWNNEISSFQIMSNSGGLGPVHGGSCGDNNNHPGQNAVVDFFEHANFAGNRVSFGVADYAILPQGWNDKISSIRIPPGVKVTVFEHQHFTGYSINLFGNWTVSNWDDHWNDRISSIRISYN